MAFTIYPSTLEFPLPAGQDLGRRAYLEPFFHAYNQAIRTAGFDRVMELQPILGYKHRLGYRKGLAQSDGLHLNRRGGRLLADAIDADWFVDGNTEDAPPV